MARLGKRPIKLSDKIEVKTEGEVLKVKGPKGELEIGIDPVVEIKVEDQQILVSGSTNEKEKHAKFGLYRALIANMVTGVETGFEKELELTGVGYRVQLQGNKLVFSIGYSHSVEVEPPTGVTFSVDGQTNVKVTGIDKQVVNQVAAKIRALRPPDAYKGKGIRYKGEIVRLKAGKSVK